jgi:non-ribosomal peptide synthetase component F
MATALDRSSSASSLETFAESFEATCLRQPDHPAVCSNELSWTYGELHHAARAVATGLLRLASTVDRPVAIRLPLGPVLVAAIVVAVLARRCFVVIDPDYPTDRILQVLEDADPALVIVSGSEDAPHAGDRAHVLVAELLKINGEDVLEALHGHPDDMACLVYTSGSTGIPKAAMVTHGAITQIGYVQTSKIGVKRSDRHAMLHSATTMGGMRTLFGALFAGATLYPYELAKLGVGSLADWLERNHITVVHTAATVIRHFAQCCSGRSTRSAIGICVRSGLTAGIASFLI